MFIADKVYENSLKHREDRGSKYSSFTINYSLNTKLLFMVQMLLRTVQE